MHAGPQKVVNRASPVVQRASNPVVTTAGTGRAMQSPYATRFAGSITQREPQIGRKSGSPSDGGKQMYRTSDGSLVELPPDMTVEQAAGLEAESKAAQKQLGKGPPPKPVPDVKSLAKKAVKKGPVPPKARGKGSDRGRGKAAPKIGGTAAALFAAVGKSTVAQYLAARGAPALLKGVGMLQKLRQNEQTHDDATEKRQQSEQAVVIPPSEGQSKGNTGQVSAIGERPAPAIDEKTAKGKLQETLEANTPRSIEDVDNFQRDAKAQHMGADVMQVVQGDKNAVTSTFGEIEQTPAPVPPEQQPETLPPEEVAPSTPNMNLGQGAVAPLQKEHTETGHYTKEADSKLKEEGVTQEQLDMVDNGDLAEANKEKKGLEKAARTEPVAVQDFARQESANVDRELQQEEKKDRDTLKAKRKSGLSATGQKQKGAKSALEKKRDEVAGKINDIYKTAQDKVKKKLADLESQSMKRFDDGNAKATRAFEVNVKRELDAFKADRYSGFWGGLKRAKDWLLGMDDLPGVKAIFDRNRASFVSTISKLVDDISADNKRVIQECKDELANARKAIREYVDQLGPRLRDIGNKAAAEMNSKLDELDQFIGKKEAELQNKLKDKQTAAIKAIDQKIEKMKEAMSGALSKLGKLLLLAAKKFFTWALQKFGYSLADIEGIINRGAAVLKAIFTKPIQFVKNLMNAALTGFKNFGKNFLKHLQNALFEWLTGSLQGLVLPKTWDFPGIIGVALQMIGISYDNVRKHMVTVMGEPVVAGLEKSFKLVKTLVKEGPMAAWEQLKEMAAEMRDAFVDAVKDFIKVKIIEQAIQWLVSLLIPGAGIIKAIIGIYDTIMFFVQKAKQIMQMIANFLGSMGEIAAGNIGAAADAMESGLARGLSLVISFLAKLLRLDGITAKIRDAIQKIRGKVDAVLLKVAKWIAAQAKKLVSRVLGGDPNATPEQRVQDGVREGVAAVNQLSGSRIGLAVIRPVLAAIRLRHNMQQLYSEPRGNRWAVVGVVNPKAEAMTQKEVDAAAAGAAVTPSAPQFYPGRSSAGWGTGMLAIKRLPTGGGSGVGTTNNKFDDLNLRRHGNATSTSTASYYVLGHLLNEGLGGPGNTWGNLTPLSRSGNAKHETEVEDDVKTAVRAGKTIQYLVEVAYGRPVSPLLAQIPANPPNPVLANKRKILLQESHVAMSLKCVVTELDPATLQPKSGGLAFTRPVDNPVEVASLTDYNVSGQAAMRLQTLALNDSIRVLSDTSRSAEHALHTQALLSLPGIGPGRIEDLKSRTYPSWQAVWTHVAGVTEDSVNAWRAGLPSGARVILNGTSTWV